MNIQIITSPPIIATVEMEEVTQVIEVTQPSVINAQLSLAQGLTGAKGDKGDTGEAVVSDEQLTEIVNVLVIDHDALVASVLNI
jgi:hypothetical protein